jgi:predicted regulator of Ras-like GTPase activity (Roadblock/LC7/MglB family)
MDRTPFSAILSVLLARVPGAYAAALVDLEGETVDYAGLGEPFDMRIAAAHMRIVLNDVAEAAALGEPRSVVVCGTRRSIVARSLPDGYALVLLLRRRAGFAASQRAFSACEHALAQEAGWAPPSGPACYPVEVEVDQDGRPHRLLQGAPETDVTLEVLGTVAGLPKRERGFRVRASDGRELTLVRETRKAWYADEAVPLPDRIAPSERVDR